MNPTLSSSLLSLKTNSSLQELYWRNNNIGATGASSLADSLKTNSSLQELDLSFNDIGDKENREIINSLMKRNIELQKIKKKIIRSRIGIIGHTGAGISFFF